MKIRRKEECTIIVAKISTCEGKKENNGKKE